jgi:DNA repair exonuclease SbcCD ATPase subunit
MKRALEIINGVRAIPALINEVRGYVHFSAMQIEFQRTIEELDSERAARQNAEARLANRTDEVDDLARACESARRELETERASHKDTQERWAAASDSWALEADSRCELQLQLETERASHEETKRKLAENQSHLGAGIDTLNKFSGDYYRDFTELQKAKTELTSALETIQKSEDCLEMLSTKINDIVAHAEKAGWNGVDNPHDLCDYIIYMGVRLSSILETIDALTRWRLQSEEPCLGIPNMVYVQVTDNPEDAFPVGVTPGEASLYKY